MLGFLLGLVLCALPSPVFCKEESPKVENLSNTQMNAQRTKVCPEDLLIVHLADNADREKFDDALAELHGKYLRTIDAGPTLKFLVIQVEPGKAAEVAKKLSKRKDVTSVERNQIYQAIGGPGGPNDPYYTNQWDLVFMNYAQARNSGLGSNTYAFLYFCDTGYTPFPGNEGPIAYQFDYSDPVNPAGTLEPLHDTGFHGSAVASVTETTDNGMDYAGEANFEGNRCVIVMFRISKDGSSASGISILDALSRIARSTLQPGPVNLSFDSAPPNTMNASASIQAVARLLQLKGHLLVLAAGNNAAADNSPEQYARRVAAIDQNGRRASFSNFGAFNTAAPGNNVPIIYYGQPYLGWGTSFAAPRWCAAIADVITVLPARYKAAPAADAVLKATATHTADGYLSPNLGAALKFAAAIH